MTATLKRWLPRQLRDVRASRSLTKANRRLLDIEKLERRDQPSSSACPNPDPNPCDPSCLDSFVNGKVYFDKNKNGAFDGDDTGISGVVITLTGTDIFGRDVSLTTRTGANGSYSFTAVKPGTYVISETQPSGFLDGAENLGSLGGSIVANDKMEVTIGLADIQAGARNYNFGELKQERDCPPPPPKPCECPPSEPRPKPPKHDHGDSNGHGKHKGDSDGHGKHKGDSNGHGKHKGDSDGHGKNKGDSNGHGKNKGDSNGHGKNKGDSNGHGKNKGDSNGHAKNAGEGGHKGH